MNCSFCGKCQDNVKALITSEKANICNECIELCIDVLIEENYLQLGELEKIKRDAFLRKIGL